MFGGELLFSGELLFGVELLFIGVRLFLGELLLGSSLWFVGVLTFLCTLQCVVVGRICVTRFFILCRVVVCVCLDDGTSGACSALSAAH